MTGPFQLTRLWTGNGFAAEGWQAETIPPLAEFLAAPGTAVRLAPGDALEPLLPHLGALTLIALEFPAYNDGRSYSMAELLRGRLGYEGRLRAVGDVLIDQIAHMLRTGFDELEINHPLAQARLEDGSHPAFPGHYQPAAKPAHPAAAYSWRRLPASR